MIRHALIAFTFASLTLTTSRAEDKDNSVAEVKKEIEHQVKLLKDGDVEKFKACFTARLKDKITKEAMESGQKNAAKVTIDDLVKDVTFGEFEGKKTAKIKMKNGRTLTTLVLTDGKWLADTIWFK